ncbi:MAG TPA: VWA domain-containing protein [Chloroflexia bacterium]|nr:VWA domain-containing protein [Chloroflexia bacterium]
MITLKAELDRRYVHADSTSECYLRVSIQVAKEAPRNRRLPLSLALVLDRSGSMAGSKLDKAREAAAYCVRQLGADDQVAVVTYDDHVDVVGHARSMTETAKRHLLDDIRHIRSGGNTNLAGGWLAGAQEVAAQTGGRLARVILLTDGLANVGMTDSGELGHHASELRARGVSTTTMGIGADFNEELLEHMARRGGGHFYFIENAAQIPDMLHRELGETLTTVARGATLEVDLPPGVEASLLNDFEQTGDGRRVRVRLDDLIAGESRVPVFRLTVQPGDGDSSLPLSARLHYQDVASGAARVLGDDSALTYATRARCEAEDPNASVQEEVELLNVARARETALRYDAAGDFATSAATLNAAAQRLQSVAPASPAAQAEAAKLEAEGQEAGAGFTGLRRKALHYDKSNRLQNRS